MDDRHQIAPYPLRMGADLRKRLEDEARAVGRSLNAEIISRLESSFDKERTLNDADRRFLMSLVNIMKSGDEAGAQKDSVLYYPDGSVVAFEIKKPTKKYEFADPADDAPVEAPRRRIRIRKEPKS